MTIPNQNLVNDLLPLMMAQLVSTQREFGWLLSSSRHSVKHADPQTRQEIQTRVDAATQGLLLVYLFAMWEEYVKRDVEREWLPADKLERLNAFRHVRHSTAHGFDGTRAHKCRAEFDAIMNSAQPFPNLAWTNDTIDLSMSQVATDCHGFMSDLAKELIGRLANDNRP